MYTQKSVGAKVVSVTNRARSEGRRYIRPTTSLPIVREPLS